MRICDHGSKDPPRLHCDYTRPTKANWLLQLLNFDFNVDPDPAFRSYSDLDPASKNNANSDPDLNSKPWFVDLLIFIQISSSRCTVSVRIPGKIYVDPVESSI